MTALPPGITTAALLKSQLDRGLDYFELLTPFVHRATAAGRQDVIDPRSLRAEITRSCGLDIPLRTLASLLERLSKRPGFGIRKEGVAFLRTDSLVAMPDTAQDVTDQFRRLGDAFATFCTTRLPTIRDGAAALGLLTQFLESHSATLVLEGAPSPSRTGRREEVVVAQFVSECLTGNNPNEQGLLSLLQGLVLARAVTLEELAEVERKLSDLAVYFDTSFVLALAGLYGPTDHDAAKDAVRILRELGAVPAVFDVTIAEVRRILAVYEDLLDTAEGRERLYPIPLTAYFFAANARGTDVRTHSELLERTLARGGLVLHDTPPRQAAYVADESRLAAVLKDFRGAGHEAREKHDLDCVAAVLTLRRGRTTARLEDAHAIFAASGMVVRTTQRWWAATETKGLSPIIDHAALLNYCWIKRPKVASRTHRYELAALCASTLKPSEQAWSAFQRELRKLAADGRITSDEAAVILIDSYASKLLVEAEATETISPGSAATIVDRVREELRGELALAQAETRRERESRTADMVVAASQREQALEAQAAAFSARLDDVGQALTSEKQRRQSLEDSVAGLARVLAWIVSVPVASLLVVLVVIVVLFPIIGGSSLSPFVQRLLQGAAVVIGIAGAAFGITAFSVGKRFHRWIESRLQVALLRQRGTGSMPERRLPPEP